MPDPTFDMMDSFEGNKQCLVSVVIPVFNREKFLASALDSVLAQTVNNYEIIAVDDGSTDTSLRILEEYRSRFPERIRILTQKNSGPSVARNNAILTARGNYIAFLDSDDLWAPTKIERQLEIFFKFKEIAFVYSGYSLIDEEGKILEERLPEASCMGDIHDKLWTTENNISGGTLMVEINRLMEVGLFDIDLRGAENLDLRIRLSKLGYVYYCSDILYFYRIHKDNLTANPESMYPYHLLLLEKHFGKNGVNNRKMWKAIRSRQLYQQGGELLQKGHCREAVSHFFHSISLNPQRPRAYINLFRCFLGGRFNRWLISLKKKNE